MGRKAPNPGPPKGMRKPPPPPTPPLSRHILSHDVFGARRCPECGSSMKRKRLFSRTNKCIHPQCGKEI